jgi:hypothetical protein
MALGWVYIKYLETGGGRIEHCLKLSTQRLFDLLVELRCVASHSNKLFLSVGHKYVLEKLYTEKNSL